MYFAEFGFGLVKRLWYFVYLFLKQFTPNNVSSYVYAWLGVSSEIGKSFRGNFTFFAKIFFCITFVEKMRNSGILLFSILTIFHNVFASFCKIHFHEKMRNFAKKFAKYKKKFTFFREIICSLETLCNVWPNKEIASFKSNLNNLVTRILFFNFKIKIST